MRTPITKSLAWMAVAAAGMSTIVLADAGISEARANGTTAAAAPVTDGTAHISHLTIRESDRLPTTRAIKLGKNKSLLVELPRDLRDVMVSAPEMMDAVVQSTNRVHLIGKKIGKSNAFFFDTNGDQVLTLEVSIEEDTAALDDIYRRLLPGSRIKSEILNETIILTGSVRSPIDATRASDIASRFIMPNPDDDKREPNKVINMLSVEGEEQVMLKVQVAEVQRTLLKQFGINMAADLNFGNMALGILTANSLPLTAAAGLGTLPIFGVSTEGDPADPAIACPAGTTCPYNSGPAPSAYGNSGTTGGWTNGTQSIQNAMRALERNGLVKTLAEPNLTAISGEAAKFLAGGEFPIPLVDSTGSVSVLFKEFGIGVAFTPVVLSEGRISLKIESEVSELTNDGAITIGGISLPALKKRQAKSTVELPSGGSLALAGLISDDTRQNIDGLPGLKDMPILGTLFRSRDFVRNETELVIMVTPYLVKPTAQQNLARPLDGLGEPSDMKGNFLGHLNRIYGGGSGTAAPQGDLKGDYGFIVE